MESFNFGAFDTQLPGRIAAIPQEAQRQQSANMLQAIQMQGAMRQNEMSQMQLDELKTDRAEMVKLQQNLAAKGGSPDLNEYADMLMKSPKHLKLGIELKQKLSDQARYDKIMLGGAPPAAPAPAPMALSPEPGSFGADVAERRAADPFASRTNMLPGAAAAPAGVNALAGGNEAVAEMRRKRAALQSIDTPQARAAIRSLDADIALASKPPAYQNVPGVGLVNPLDRSVVMPSVEPKANSIKELEAFMKMTPKEQATFMAMRRAGASNVTVKNEQAYGGAIATGAAKQDLAQIDRAQSLPQEFAKIDETLGILRNTDINTGLGADLFTVLDKARAQVTADKKAGKRAVNTEYLDSLLGSAVFPQIQALGIGARGMDTPAEREFLRKVMTGTVGLTKDTLIQMTELRRKGLENESTLFNKRVEKGEFKPFEEAARRKVEAVTVPPLPTNATKGVARPTGVGSDWMLMTDAKGNSAWVSPDRKTFKEAK